MVGIRTRFVRAALVGGVLVILFAMVGVGSPAMAQEDPEVDEDSGTAAQRQRQEFEAEQAPYTEAVTVTGTLIPRPTLDALSPVAVMGVEDITYSGITRIEDLMAQLPQADIRLILRQVVKGESYAQMAEAENLPIGTVMSRLARARARLRSDCGLPVSGPVAASLTNEDAA